MATDILAGNKLGGLLADGVFHAANYDPVLEDSLDYSDITDAYSAYRLIEAETSGQQGSMKYGINSSSDKFATDSKFLSGKYCWAFIDPNTSWAGWRVNFGNEGGAYEFVARYSAHTATRVHNLSGGGTSTEPAAGYSRMEIRYSPNKLVIPPFTGTTAEKAAQELDFVKSNTTVIARLGMPPTGGWNEYVTARTNIQYNVNLTGTNWLYITFLGSTAQPDNAGRVDFFQFRRLTQRLRGTSAFYPHDFYRMTQIQGAATSGSAATDYTTSSSESTNSGTRAAGESNARAIQKFEAGTIYRTTEPLVLEAVPKRMRIRGNPRNSGATWIEVYASDVEFDPGSSAADIMETGFRVGFIGGKSGATYQDFSLELSTSSVLERVKLNSPMFLYFIAVDKSENYIESYPDQWDLVSWKLDMGIEDQVAHFNSPYRNALRSGLFTMTAYVEFYQYDPTGINFIKVGEYPVVDGSVTYEHNTKTTRSCDLTFVFDDQQYAEIALAKTAMKPGIAWVRVTSQVGWGRANEAGQVVAADERRDLPLGLFQVHDMNVVHTSSGIEMKVRGYDVSRALRLAGIRNKFNAGSTSYALVDAFLKHGWPFSTSGSVTREILGGVPEWLLQNVTMSTDLYPEIPPGQDFNPYDLSNEWLAKESYASGLTPQLWPSRSSEYPKVDVVVFPDSYYAQPVDHFDRNYMIAQNETRDDEYLVNCIILGDNGTGPRGSATAQKISAVYRFSSGTEGNAGRYGVRTMYEKLDYAAASLAEMDEYAGYLIDEARVRKVTIELEVPPSPHLDANDLIAITDPSTGFFMGTWNIEKIVHFLGGDTSTKITAVAYALYESDVTLAEVP